MLVLNRIFLARLQRFDRIILRFKRLNLIFLIFLKDSLLLAYYIIVSTLVGALETDIQEVMS